MMVALHLPMSDARAPRYLTDLVDRFDESCFMLPRREQRVRVECGSDPHDVVVGPRGVRVEAARGRGEATLAADPATWTRIASDLRGGMEAYSRRRLHVRGNLHLAVGLLAATSGSREPGRLRVQIVRTSMGEMALQQSGSGEPVLMLHGLGGTKASFLPTMNALSDHYRCIAVDLPGFGDSTKPIGAPYHAPYFARAAGAVLDALDIPRAHILGHSMGGRAALEMGIRHEERTAALVLLMPSMAWRRSRQWAPWLRFVRPELGLLQLAPRPAVEAVVHRLLPGAADGWMAAGIDEFLRAYLDPRGRAAFYAAARSIYLEQPEGEHGFWTKLAGLRRPALFVWGSNDRLVPLAFERHVREVLPHADHVVVRSGHVPQFERPAQTHGVVLDFLSHHPMGRRRAA
jgi:pimeloyl-ACP methyl ester carboxylesterase